MVQFVGKFIGGQQPYFLEEIEEFSKQLAVCRDVPPLFYGQLAMLPLLQAPVYVIALLKATMACPDKYMCHGFPKLFDQGDLGRISTKLAPAVKQACGIMKRAREFLKVAGIPDNAPARISMLSELDVALVLKVHGESAPDRVEHASQVAIGIDFYNACTEYWPKVVFPACPWHTVPLAAMAYATLPDSTEPLSILATPKKAIKRQSMQIREQEVTAEELTSANFKVGTCVMHQKQTWTIKSVCNGLVTIESTEAVERKSLPYAVVMDECTVHNEPSSEWSEIHSLDKLSCPNQRG